MQPNLNPTPEVDDGTDITLRDRFAMAALTGILADSPTTTLHPNVSNSVSVEAAAGAAYKFADAMLSARKQ